MTALLTDIQRRARAAAVALGRRLPEQVVRAGVAAASRSSPNPTVRLPHVRSAVVVAPHPDDETLGCGGAVALLTARGCHVTVIVLSDGEASACSMRSARVVAGRRRADTSRACAALGVRDVRFAGLPDGQLREPDVIAVLEGPLGSIRPEVVFAPWRGDGHPDHRVAGHATFAAVPSGTELWCYEIWSPLVPDALVDVTNVIDRKRAAAAAHTTAAGAVSFEALLALGRYRAAQGLAGYGWAEAFELHTA